jgi:hypothetical protein
MGRDNEFCGIISTRDILQPNFVPRLLSNGQREHRAAVSSELKEHIENDINFNCSVITGDESWVYG